MQGIVRAALAGGLVAGTLDIAYAFMAHGARGISPAVILRSVASGLLGRDAYAGGMATVALGAALHYLMAIAMAAGFVLMARRWRVLLQAPRVAGALYGLALFGVMNLVVVPLSAAWPGNMPRGWLLAGALFAHVVLVGLPIALVARAVALRSETAPENAR
jgi:uncharacterized membrane protein YagU involved in acid resistance